MGVYLEAQKFFEFSFLVNTQVMGNQMVDEKFALFHSFVNHARHGRVRIEIWCVAMKGKLP